jgi:hypothetical protein
MESPFLPSFDFCGDDVRCMKGGFVSSFFAENEQWPSHETDVSFLVDHHLDVDKKV